MPITLRTSWKLLLAASLLFLSLGQSAFSQSNVDALKKAADAAKAQTGNFS